MRRHFARSYIGPEEESNSPTDSDDSASDSSKRDDYSSNSQEEVVTTETSTQNQAHDQTYTPENTDKFQTSNTKEPEKTYFMQNKSPERPSMPLESNSDSESSSESGDEQEDTNKKPKFIRNSRHEEEMLPVQSSSRKADTMSLFQKAVSSEIKHTSIPNVDDTDGIDPDAEYQAWIERERGRMTREHAKLAEREERLMEIEENRLIREAKRKKYSPQS